MIRIKNEGVVEWVVLVIVALAAGAGLIAAHYTKQDDTPIEEVSEQIIKSQTGYDVDLTPKSPESAKQLPVD